MAEFTPQTVKDGFLTFEGGMNSGSVPELLKPNELSMLVNGTVRGGFVTNRPSYRQMVLDYGGNTVLQQRVEKGRWQGGCYMQLGEGKGCLIASIGGRLFRFNISAASAFVVEITITGQTVNTVGFVVPAVGADVTITVFSTANFKSGYQIAINGKNYRVKEVVDGQVMIVTNVDDVPGTLIAVNSVVQFWDVNPATRLQAWLWQSEDTVIVNDGQSLPIFYNGATSRRSGGDAVKELPPGRMGAYGNGRNWMSLPDGVSYIASDLVGTYSSTGVPAYLRVTENAYLNGGGSFKVPGNVGSIYAMRFVAIPDTSLGQGPLLIFTPKMVFSCSTPFDRTVWTAVENPLQTVSLIANGGLSHYSTISVNSDVFYRSIDGIRSWILGRREFTSWGNTPISREMNRILDADDPALLYYSSAIYFDNRLLMTCSPVFTQKGIYHRGLVALDFDIISSMRGKLPAVYDGLWTGLTSLQLINGTFSTVERAFDFVLFAVTNDEPTIQLWEIQKSGEDYQDNGSIPILWQFETAALEFVGRGMTSLDVKRLINGELFVDDVLGLVNFQTFYRPDSFPCWVPWHDWAICQKNRDCGIDPLTGCLTLNDFKPTYRNRMGMGEPNPKDCYPVAQTPLREGTSFQIRIAISGHCRIQKQRYMAVPTDESVFARLDCTTLQCFGGQEPPPAEVFWNTEQSFEAVCPDGFSGEPVTATIPAHFISSPVSVEAANELALSAAQTRAEASLVCEADPTGCFLEEWGENDYRIAGYVDGVTVITNVASVSAQPAWDGTFPSYTVEEWRSGSDDAFSLGGKNMTRAVINFLGCDEDNNPLFRIGILANGGEYFIGFWNGAGSPTDGPVGTFTLTSSNVPGQTMNLTLEVVP
jgi:hypothetical protein